MSLEPDHSAAEAFERLRLEVALLRRAVEGLAAAGEPIDYSPTLAELVEAVAQARDQLAAISQRPVLALTLQQAGGLVVRETSRLLAAPLAQLDRDRAALVQAVEVLRAADEAEHARARSTRRTAALVSVGAILGAVLWSALLGPLARALPSAWAVPERLAAATLDLPPKAAGERLLARGDPAALDELELVSRRSAKEVRALRECANRKRRQPVN